MKVLKTNAAFTHNDLDDQKRNLTFVKMDFQVFKLEFHACNFKQVFYPLHKLSITFCETLTNFSFGTWFYTSFSFVGKPA